MLEMCVEPFFVVLQRHTFYPPYKLFPVSLHIIPNGKIHPITGH
jgi:hypothetical protein